jgi:hypothetical protein
MDLDRPRSCSDARNRSAETAVTEPAKCGAVHFRAARRTGAKPRQAQHRRARRSCRSERSWRTANSRRKRRREKATAVADRAAAQVDARELAVEPHVVGQVIDIAILGSIALGAERPLGARRRLQQLTGGAELGLYVARGEQAVVADADEAFGEHVQEQPAQELDGGQRRVLAVARAKPDALVIDVQEPRVADGRAMGVAAEVGVDRRGVAEGELAVHDPALAAERIEQVHELKVVVSFRQECVST